MDVSYMLFLQGSFPEPKEDDDEEPVTEKSPEQTPSPNPVKPQPATPDANPIDPRVGQPW